MRSNPLLWVACHASGLAAGWSLSAGEPWRQTLALTLIWLVAAASSLQRHLDERAAHRMRNPEPSRN